jgi:hypothetical protein
MPQTEAADEGTLVFPIVTSRDHVMARAAVGGEGSSLAPICTNVRTLDQCDFVFMRFDIKISMLDRRMFGLMMSGCGDRS